MREICREEASSGSRNVLGNVRVYSVRMNEESLRRDVAVTNLSPHIASTADTRARRSAVNRSLGGRRPAQSGCRELRIKRGKSIQAATNRHKLRRNPNNLRPKASATRPVGGSRGPYRMLNGPGCSGCRQGVFRLLMTVISMYRAKENNFPVYTGLRIVEIA